MAESAPPITGSWVSCPPPPRVFAVAPEAGQGALQRMETERHREGEAPKCQPSPTSQQKIPPVLLLHPSSPGTTNQSLQLGVPRHEGPPTREPEMATSRNQGCFSGPGNNARDVGPCFKSHSFRCCPWGTLSPNLTFLPSQTATSSGTSVC